MKVTVRGEYALKLVLDLAARPAGANIKIRDIARRQRMPFKFLQQTARLLARAGILRARRGPDGGVALARPPARISVGDVVRAVEGARSGIYCLSERGNAVCPDAASCPLRPLWLRIQRDIARMVDTTTFDQLAAAGAPAHPRRRTIEPRTKQRTER